MENIWLAAILVILAITLVLHDWYEKMDDCNDGLCVSLCGVEANDREAVIYRNL